MGQYYTLFNLDKKQFVKPRDIGRNGLKMLEFSYDKNAFVKAMSYLLANDWQADRVALIGDYAVTEYPDNPSILSGGGAKRLRDLFKRAGEEPYDPWARAYEGYEKPIEYKDASEALTRAFGSDVENIPTYRYVINVTQGVYVDRKHEPVAWCWSEHDDNGREIDAGVTRYDYLPILMSAGDTLGLGDWRDETGKLAGAWIGDELAFTNEAPTDAQELDYAAYFPRRENCLPEDEVAEAQRKLSQHRLWATGANYVNVRSSKELANLPEVEPDSLAVNVVYAYQHPYKPPKCRKLRVEYIGRECAAIPLRTCEGAKPAFIIHTPKGSFRIFEHEGRLWRERAKLPLRDELQAIVKRHEPSGEIIYNDYKRRQQVPIEYSECFGKDGVKDAIAADFAKLAVVNGVLCDECGEPQYALTHDVSAYISDPDELWLCTNISSRTAPIVFASACGHDDKSEQPQRGEVRLNALQIVRALNEARAQSVWYRPLSDSALLAHCWIEVIDRSCVRTDPYLAHLEAELQERARNVERNERWLNEARDKLKDFEAEYESYLARKAAFI